MVSQGCIKPLRDFLACLDPRIIMVCLEGLENILKVGEAEKAAGAEEFNYCAQLIEEGEGRKWSSSLLGRCFRVLSR